MSLLSRNDQRLLRWIRGTGTFVDVLSDNRRTGITDAISMNLPLGARLPTVVKSGFVRSDRVFRADLLDHHGPGPSFASMVGRGG